MSDVVATAQQGLAGKYKQYPEYKDSGVEWLGEVPIDWGASRHKYIATFAKGKNPKELFDEVGIGRHQYLAMGFLRGLEVPKYCDLDSSTILVMENQILIIWDGSNAGEFVKATHGVLSSTMAAVTTNSNIHDGFYWYYCKSIEPEMRRHANGMGIPHVDGDELKAIVIPQPALEEQRSIAAFLDYETARIDRLIAQQQRLIELLKEKRQAVISHAVTKGLNPNAPMKDSGVEWLGQVPEHWVVTNLKYVFDSLDYRRIPLSAEQRGERQGDYPYYGASGVIDGVDDYLFDEECVLVGEDGANLIMRSTPLAFVVSGKYWVNNHAHILRMHDGLNRYWAAVINNVDIKPIVSGSAQPKLTAEALGNIKVAFPQDTTEREELLIHINAETPKFDELIGHANQQVILLKERRSALISAAVTGKIDLRGWTPPAEEVAA
ncbi:restriction endonuclease subunit S [Aeromonas sanarellii]